MKGVGDSNQRLPLVLMLWFPWLHIPLHCSLLSGVCVDYVQTERETRSLSPSPSVLSLLFSSPRLAGRTRRNASSSLGASSPHPAVVSTFNLLNDLFFHQRCSFVTLNFNEFSVRRLHFEFKWTDERASVSSYKVQKNNPDALLSILFFFFWLSVPAF